jgi:hypothetical protein
MKMKDDQGNETWIEPNDLKYIKITDENNLKHEYFSSSDRLPVERGLLEIMYESHNIMWYKDYRNRALDMNLQIRGIIVDKNKKIIYDGFFYDSKGKFKKIFGDYPDLEEKLKSAKEEKDYIELLRLYDAKIDQP